MNIQTLENVINSKSYNSNNLLNDLLKAAVETFNIPEGVCYDIKKNYIIVAINSLDKEDLMDELEEDYSLDFENIGSNIISNFIFILNFYLSTHLPYDAINILLNHTSFDLFTAATDLYESELQIISRKVNEVQSLTNKLFTKEYGAFCTYTQKAYYKFSNYKDGRENLEEFDFRSGNLLAISYNTLINVPPRGLWSFEIMLDNLIIENGILSRFDPKDVNRLCSAYKKKRYIFQNSVEVVILNYAFAGLYSDHPEDLKISRVMAESFIAPEVHKKMITLEDIQHNIFNGVIKFDENERQYLERTLIQKIMYFIEKQNLSDAFVIE